MKHNVTAYIFGLLLLLCACAREEDDVFGKPAAQRAGETAAQYAALLTAAQHGWLMEYFASESLIGGYTFACAFAEDGTVAITADLSTEGYAAGTPQTSLYRIASDRGAALSFDTYSVLHTLSEPRGGSMANDSYGGDYEFVITRAAADSIFLKGKKYGTPLLMLRLAEPIADYFGRLMATAKSIDALPRMRVTAAGSEYDCVKEDHRTLKVYHPSGESASYPFIYTEKGMRLLRPMAVGSVSVQELRLDSDGKTLRGLGADIALPYPTPVELLLAKTQWRFNFYIARDTVVYRDTLKLLISEKLDTIPLSTPDSVKYIYELVAKDTVLTDTAVFSYVAIDSASMCSAMFGILQEAYDRNYSAYGEIFSGLYIGVNGVYITDRYVDPNPYAFVFASGGYNITYGLHFKDDGRGNLEIRPLADGLNFGDSDYFMSVVSYIGNHSPYRLDVLPEAGSDKAGNPKKIKYVSAGDSSVWFVLQNSDD
jgi:hypothetical protein